jgi:phospholipid transport system substrate-binding protein
MTIALVMVVGAQACFPAEETDAEVRAFVERVNSASTALTANGSEADARQKCKELLSWAFDVPAMAEYALGDAWSKASADERKRFLDAFEDLIVGEYVDRMSGGATMTFVGTRTDSSGEILAASRVGYPGRPEQTWIWKMRPKEGGWRIIDVLVNGRSAILGERKTYAEVLAANDGKMQAVIDYVRSLSEN